MQVHQGFLNTSLRIVPGSSSLFRQLSWKAPMKLARDCGAIGNKEEEGLGVFHAQFFDPPFEPLMRRLLTRVLISRDGPYMNANAWPAANLPVHEIGQPFLQLID